jgi:hypothetical protein
VCRWCRRLGAVCFAHFADLACGVGGAAPVARFITALPSMASVFLVMEIIFYIGSVMATKLFVAYFPEWFGTLDRSAYSLFQIMTLES